MLIIIDTIDECCIISLVQITASKERIMNKAVEYPYEGCHPENEGGFKIWFLVMMALFGMPILSLVVQEKILFHWGYIIAIYPIGVLVWWFGYFLDYREMLICADEKNDLYSCVDLGNTFNLLAKGRWDGSYFS
jgi:hypothetical protein